MKAMTLEKCAMPGSNPLKLCEIETPSPKGNEVLIKVCACGVCHTDLHLVEGELKPKKPNIIPGHEIIGTVEKTGDSVKELKKGDKVGIPWLYSTCGNCGFCLEGKENLCESALFTGWHVNGGYAQYVIGIEGFTYKIPDFKNLPDDYHIAPLMCAGVVGYRAYKLSGIKEGQKLALFGFGATAHIIIQIACFHGCEVYVFTRSDSHKKHAENLGARWVGNPKDSPDKKMDCSIIFAPAGEITLRALEVTKKGGTVANSSIYSSDIPAMNYEKHLYYEKKLLSVANSTRKDINECLSVCGKAEVKTDIEVFPFTQANKVLELLKKSEISGAAVLSFS